MSPGSAKSLVLAGLVCLAACNPQPSPQRDHSLEVRYQVDPARHRVWWLTREGVSLHDVTKPQPIALTLPGWHWAGEPYGACLPDLALGPQGEAIVTSDVIPTLWRVDPETLAVTVHPLSLETDRDKDVGFSAIVYSREHGVFFGVSGIHGSLWTIDPSLTRAQKIALSDAVRRACHIATAARVVRERSGRLCVGAPDRDWTIDLRPNRRAGDVHVALSSCRSD
jgi:hypothetical protein